MFREERGEFFEYEEEPLPVIVLKGVDREAHRIVESYNVRKVLEEKSFIREKLLEKGFLKKIKDFSGRRPCTVALDTGFTSPPLELTGGRLLVIIRSHVFHGCSSCGEYPASDSVGYVRFTDKTEAVATPLSKLYERKFILDILEDKANGELDVDLVIVDGELFPRTPPGYGAPSRRESTIMKLYSRIVATTREILELASKTDTALVGIVKRSYGHDIAVRLLDKSITLNDKALASFILKRGEWIDLGSYTDIGDDIKNFIEKYREELSVREIRSLNERLSWIASVIGECSPASSIGVAVYKAFNPTYFMISTKIEYWVSSRYGVGDLVSYLASITSVNGVPHPIDLVDSMSMVRRDLLYLIQQQLFQELARLIGDKELAMSIAGLTNPEKMGKIGFK